MLSLLLEAAARSIFLAVTVWLGLKLFRIKNPYTELTLWTAVLVAALAMPLLITLAPPMLRVVLPSLPAAMTETNISAVVSGMWPMTARSLSAGAFVFAAYGLGASVLVVRLLAGLVLTHRLRLHANRLQEDWVAGRDVRVSGAIATPFSFGSTILVPSDYGGWSPKKRQAVIAHELSHVLRGDFYVQIVSALHRCAFWFSPLSWWLDRRLADLAERASDAAAIEAIGSRPAYLDILISVASRARAVHAGIAMARPGPLARRATHILSDASLPTRMTRKSRLAIFGLIVPLAFSSATIAASLDVDNLTPGQLAARKIVPPRANPRRPVTQPVYPPESKRVGEQGTVVLLLTVDETGKVVGAEIYKTSGFDHLDESAKDEALQNWRLLPGMVKGKPKEMRYRFAVTFKITRPLPGVPMKGPEKSGPG